MEDFNEGVDGKLASRMRRVNPEQFATLVKMHLSFELDISTEDNDPITEKAKLKKWGLLNFSKKPKSMMNLQQKTVERGTLTSERISQVKQLIDYLSKEQCISQEGIFRRTGKLTRQQELKSSLYQGLPLKLDNGTYSVHDCASVLKCFLAELPEPLLTELHYPSHCQIAELCYSNSEANDSRLIRSVQLLLLLLPPVNRILLKYLLNLLNKTATFESNNKMNCDTLATLFTPHLMCPRKLSPEALHINSQILSGLVALMIRKSDELFEIPTKLATDIRAYWVEQERKLLSPCKNDLNESVSDITDTAHTVFSFIDHKLTAKANTIDDTQAALAKLYAHIQAMPESAKKRRLVKQFNKENGQGTPRHVKQIHTKSLGDSIKKHIFHKKLLGHKKFIDINIGCNVRRSSSEENIFVETFQKSIVHPKRLFSKSDDELSVENFDINTGNLMLSKQFSNSADNISNLTGRNSNELNNFVNIQNNEVDNHCQPCDEHQSSIDSKHSIKFPKNDEIIQNNSSKNDNSKLLNRKVRRYNSEPIDMFTSRKEIDESNCLIEHKTYKRSFTSRKTNFEVVFTPNNPISKTKYNNSLQKNNIVCPNTSPMAKNKFWNVYGAHTSTPSLANREYGLTPAATDKSMSPISRSTTKMTKAMQETMMTPRSRKPLMMVSGTSLCNLVALEKDCAQTNPNSQMHLVNIDIEEENSCSTSGESIKVENADALKGGIRRDNSLQNIKNNRRPPLREHNIITTIDEDFTATIQPSSVSITSTFREYLLSRSVLTASPVDLSFTSRTGDFEQSESDLNILNQENLSNSLLHCLDGNNPNSDTSGSASTSTSSVNNSSENIDDIILAPRKRGTNLQRNDSKRSLKNVVKSDKQSDEIYIQKNETNSSESNVNVENLKDIFQETSF
ncbi:hypothetical protein PV328_003250 [Microctonus aethiopoides]|uniref:Rho-GAP domain-containing protein n=1 Tax=Microctonus aethiopoides TaxID=144406 RepID=A0AA39KKG4_9HYME|nr:hypothetical protein PV328_003250 [Microctonus aethiopoides]